MMTTTTMLQGHDNKTPVLLVAIEMGLKSGSLVICVASY